MLIVFGGLPGTGKTTLARALARDLGATYLRVDEIEQAMRDWGLTSDEVGVSGYCVGYALAESNLRLGAVVVADSVNPMRVTRASWRDVAERASVKIVEVEIICTDKVEHRRRAESRDGDISGLLLPTWQQITERSYDAWDRDRI
ncbi:MAG TPA: AAA family ATPase, partial [Opitutaceae bacterium]